MRLRAAIITCVLAAGIAAALVAAWRFVQRAGTLPQASCGAFITHDLGSSTTALTADRGALRCFSAAARRCVPASIEIVAMGVDSGTNYVVTLRPNSPNCQASELRQDYGWTGGSLSTGPITAASCRLATVSGRGVTLGCGSQDVLIPAAVTIPRIGHAGPAASPEPTALPTASCGEVFTAHLGARTRILSGAAGALGCFKAAAHVCRPASIWVSVVRVNGPSAYYVITVGSGRTACRVTEFRQDWRTGNSGFSSGPVTSVSCRLIEVTGTGVSLGCSGQRVLIPAR